jgi:SAM-dependent methyltransferase
VTERLAEVSTEATVSGSACLACSTEVDTFYRVEDVPAHSCVLFTDREAALAYPRGQVELGFCPACGFIQNTRFDERLVDYARDYEETQGFSPHFRDFARRLATHLVERYDLREKEILEIGCGKGEFLALLCELGENRGIGIDPAFVPERTPTGAAERIRYLQEFYTVESTHLTGDLVCCRHTLEHVPRVREFMGWIRQSVERSHGSILFLEVPDTARVLEEVAFWDIYYEHCSYFTAGSLGRLVRDSGFEVLDLRKDFGDQYLLLESRAGDIGTPLSIEESVALLSSQVDSFTRRQERELARWREILETAHDEGRRAVLWGAGSKAVAFLTTLSVGDQIVEAVDINPYKQGTFLPGTGHRVVGPRDLAENPPDLVVVMNSVYMEEIRGHLEEIAPNADFVAV